MWEPTAEIQAATAAPSRAIGCGSDRGGKRSSALGREGTGRERQNRSGPGTQGCGSWGWKRERGHPAARTAARRGEKAAVGSVALIGRAGGVGSGATRHRAEPAPRGGRGPRGDGRVFAERRRRAGGTGTRTTPGPAAQRGGGAAARPPHAAGRAGPGAGAGGAGLCPGDTPGRLPSLAGTGASAGGCL